MTNALKDHEGSVSIGGRTIKNLHFADDIDALVGTEEKLFNFVNQVDKASTTSSMDFSAEKTELITNNNRGISSDIRINGQNLEAVQSFKYLVSLMTDEGSKQEILSRIAQTVGASSKLKTIWKDKNIALSSKIRMVRSLVISIFLHSCETWIIAVEL